MFILQILSLTFFHKKLQKVCHANCSRVVSSFPTPSRLLGAPTIINQMRFVGNFVFGKFYSISKKDWPRFYKRASVLVLLEKEISPQFFVQYFYKNIHNLGIKMFYQNSEHTFVLYYLIFALVKIHVNIYATWTPKLRISPKTIKIVFQLCTGFFNFPQIYYLSK